MENKRHSLNFVNWLMEECTLEVDKSTDENVLWRYQGDDYSNAGIYDVFAEFQKQKVNPPIQIAQLIESWNNLPQIEKDILGRPNFACGSIARRMRGLGFECPTKAESEQALVIFSMLKFHENHGEDWSNKMAEFLTNGISQQENKPE